jgi:peptidoglycan/xylan/chitin deacetylase (PgdA/CDA1 family)
VSITFDNLGEAMELSLGTWPAEAALGRHHSVTHVLPRILELLQREGVRCTYFVEGWSAEMYPDAVRSLQAAGHEVACHGWRHEPWSTLAGPEHESDLVRCSVDSLRAHGADPRGFRPPGGRLNPWSSGVLREHGFSYVSPAGSGAGVLEGLVALPFAWRATDAFYLFEAFGGLRRSLGEPTEPLPPDRLIADMDAMLRETIAARGYASLVFHPFLHGDPERFAAMRQVIAAVAHSDDIWCASAKEHADWLLAHDSAVHATVELDARRWH